MVPQRSYYVTVEEVHSGDDLMVLVDLGIDKLYKKVRIRLQGVDTPNAYKAKNDTEAGLLRDEVKRITANKCRIEVVSEGKGGWLVVLFAEDPKKRAEVNVNELLVTRGFVYKGKPDGPINGIQNQTSSTCE